MGIIRLLHTLICKRSILFLTAGLLLIGSTLNCSAGKAIEVSEVVSDTFGNTPRFSVSGDRMALLSEGKLYVKSGEEWLLLGEYPAAKSVVLGEGVIFLCEQGNEGDSLAIIQADGVRGKDFHLPEGSRIQYMTYAGSSIALTIESKLHDHISHFLPHAGKPYLFSISSNSLIPLPYDMVLDLSVDESGRIYVLHESNVTNNWIISRLEAESFSSKELIRLNPLDAVEFCAVADGVYVLSSRYFVDFIAFDGGQRQRVVDPKLLGIKSLRDLIYQNGKLYGYETDTVDLGKLFKYDLKQLESQATRVLTIANLYDGDMRTSYMEKWFAQHYPTVHINYITVDETTLATQLMSGVSNIDMVYGHDSLIGQYAKSGAFFPLDGFSRLAFGMEQSGFLNYRPAMTYNDHLFGVASFVIFYIFEPNEPLLNSLGLLWPDAPYSWTELADWAISALQGTEYKLYNQLIGADPAGQYVDYHYQTYGKVLLDTTEFRTAMEAYRRLYQADLIDISNETDQSLTVANQTYMGRIAAAPLPTLEGQPVSVAEVLGFYVSVGSHNLDLVEAYLTEYVSSACQYSAPYGDSGNMLLRDSSGYDRGGYGTDIQFGQPTYAGGNEQLRISAYNSIVVKHRNVFLIGALGYRTQMLSYLDDEIDINEYIRLVQPKLDMIQYE